MSVLTAFIIVGGGTKTRRSAAGRNSTRPENLGFATNGLQLVPALRNIQKAHISWRLTAMLHSLDLFTLQMASILASTAFGLVFAGLWRGRLDDKHLLYWSASSLLYAADLIAFMAIDPLPLPVGCCLYGLLTVSNILGLSGLRLIERRKPFALWMVGLVATTMTAYAAPVFAQAYWPTIPSSCIPISRAVGLIISMAVVGTACIRSGRRCASRGGAIAGIATLGYIPGYLVSIAAELGWPMGNDWLALIPMISDQLLLGLLNLGLLAIPIERAQARLREMALRDPLTGCWNRAGYETLSSRKAGNDGMIVAIDIDHFKQINDRWGHAAGDDALVALARAARMLAEPLGGDVARMGGDEFLILLPNRSELDARSFANQLRKSLAKIPASEPWTISLGLARLNVGETDYAAAARRADASLYQAKHQGRDRVAA